MNQSKEMTKLAIAALEDKKANYVRVIDIAGVSVELLYMALQRNSARPGPRKLIAVPAMVWSAWQEIHA